MLHSSFIIGVVLPTKQTMYAILYAQSKGASAERAVKTFRNRLFGEPIKPDGITNCMRDGSDMYTADTRTQTPSPPPAEARTYPNKLHRTTRSRRRVRSH